MEVGSRKLPWRKRFHRNEVRYRRVAAVIDKNEMGRRGYARKYTFVGRFVLLAALSRAMKLMAVAEYIGLIVLGTALVALGAIVFGLR
jgi:hypothetical protein